MPASPAPVTTRCETITDVDSDIVFEAGPFEGAARRVGCTIFGGFVGVGLLLEVGLDVFPPKLPILSFFGEGSP